MTRPFYALIFFMCLLLVVAVCSPEVRRAKAETSTEVQAVVCQPYLQWDCSWALATVWRESRNDNTAVNPSSGAACWFQMHPIHGYDPALLISDPWICTGAAYDLWLLAGYTPWRLN